MRLLPVAVALAFLAACTSAPASGTISSPRADSPRPSVSAAPSVLLVPVTKVTDGDTIHVTYQGHDDRVRLIGVNTPEVDWYGGEAECFGAQAGHYAQRRLNGATVGLVFDVNLRDRYGRLLAYVYVGTELFNLTLVQQGYAVADPVPPDTQMAPLFAGAESKAKAAGRGLWSACPTPP